MLADKSRFSISVLVLTSVSNLVPISSQCFPNSDIKAVATAIHHDPILADKSRFVLHVLHSSVPSYQQRQAFCRPAPGQRKIVLATNIAETSITIDDVVHVIGESAVRFTVLMHIILTCPECCFTQSRHLGGQHCC